MIDHRKLAEEIAEHIIISFAEDIEYMSVREMTKDYLKGSLSEQETDDLIEAVDSIIRTAEIEVKLSKVRP